MIFFIAGRCEEAIKKTVLEPLSCALGVGLFYINDIIASLQKPKKQYKSFVMNYNTQLCNTAWGKKLLARVTQCTCFCSKTVTVIFFVALAKKCLLKCKTSLLPLNETVLFL
jgi:hypothetical protein